MNINESERLKGEIVDVLISMNDGEDYNGFINNLYEVNHSENQLRMILDNIKLYKVFIIPFINILQ